MTQHSPGPWSLDENDLRDEAQTVLSDQTGCPIAEAYLQARGGECEANARLIATAPEMRHALNLLAAIRPSNWDDDDDPETVIAWRALDAVVAKAEERWS